jgi:predicted anti-sigma-YlaC factor YlaD
MSWNMNCRKTRRLLALWAGSDLEQRERQVAERHLAACPGCRDVWLRLAQSQHVLESVRSAPLENLEQAVPVRPASVWPWVSRHIRAMHQTVVLNRADSRGASWRDWLPAGAVAAACVAIISVTLSEVPLGDSVSPSVIESSPAAYDSNPRHLGPFPLGLYREGNQPRHEGVARPDDNEPPSF